MFELVHYTAYSSDLAPINYYHFSKMKKKQSGCHFESYDDSIVAVDHFLEVQDTKYYKEGIHMLHDRWTK